MRLSKFIFLFIALALTSCVTPFQTREIDVLALSQSVTSAEWENGAIWTFQTTDSSGKSEVFTFLVTDEPAKPCADGDWKSLKPIDGSVTTDHRPAYMTQGAFLTILLNSNFCHVGQFQGELTGNTFKGNYDYTGPENSNPGLVDGQRVK